MSKTTTGATRRISQAITAPNPELGTTSGPPAGQWGSGDGTAAPKPADPVSRALGAEHIRHRHGASTEVLLRRLLSLDYVIEHTDLPWLPTEQEKVAAFEALGIERSLLPVRV